MLMFIVPPFFWADDEGEDGLLDAVPARAAAISIAAPIAPMAPESHARLRIALLSKALPCPTGDGRRRPSLGGSAMNLRSHYRGEKRHSHNRADFDGAVRTMVENRERSI